MSKSRPQPWITAKSAATSEGSPSSGSTSKKGSPSWQRQLAATSRWLHIYLSMASFVIVLFFAVTGLTLNHADWFDDQSTEQELTGKLTPAWVNPTDTAAINKLAVVEFLRTTHGIKGALSEFRIDDRECSVSFRGPGYTADAFVDREDGTYKLTEARLGLVAIINDLHKGRDTGKGWSWVIDGSAIFMTLISATGLIILLFLRKRRVIGLILAVLGTLLCYGAYMLIGR
ncbi:PepSY-associated TM helix domain-containing protein [Fibrella forsythiae]|uniref:PepSY-associated TM helix domain-containing protein n=1 Tax=Fibrella forsythiae TaxID=2817061 RepID=A0ABS3JHA4_9BACT|nr:PepSY-associated TM helix domain-containing protein [Fibrella forsythiae]MBO0949389.1 PepSY-associated TM helix domain-containing protein [Fibrella forsythiae]